MDNESKKRSIVMMSMFELLLVGNPTESLKSRESLLLSDKQEELGSDWRIELVSYLRIINDSTSDWIENIDNIVCTLIKDHNNERKFFRGQLREIANLKDRKVFSDEMRANQEDFILTALLHYFKNQQ